MNSFLGCSFLNVYVECVNWVKEKGKGQEMGVGNNGGLKVFCVRVRICCVYSRTKRYKFLTIMGCVE